MVILSRALIAVSPFLAKHAVSPVDKYQATRKGQCKLRVSAKKILWLKFQLHSQTFWLKQLNMNTVCDIKPGLPDWSRSL